METFSALLALCEASDICAWTNGWANNRDAGDLRRHLCQYEVTVIIETANFFVDILLT